MCHGFHLYFSKHNYNECLHAMFEKNKPSLSQIHSFLLDLIL